MEYASTLDKQHALRKLAAHRVIARCLRGDKGTLLLAHARESLTLMQEYHGNTSFVSGWHQLLADDRIEIARQIIVRNDEMETLRESSPLMKVYGFDFGRNMPIDFQDSTIRTRMWKLSQRIASIGRSDEKNFRYSQPIL